MSFIFAASKSLMTDTSNSSCTCMCGTIPSFKIKNKVDYESGPNWGKIE